MLIRPRPGADRRAIRDVLNKARNEADNFRSGRGNETGYSRLVRYLDWATETAGTLRHYISDADVNRLILTSRYQTLLASSGTLVGGPQERLVNILINHETAERVQAFDEAIGALNERIAQWNGLELFVVADASFYIQNPQPLADADLHDILNLPTGDHIRLLFPIVVVDELDGLKEASKRRSRWRAAHTLGRLDEILDGRTSGIMRHAQLSRQGPPYGEVSVEIVLDPPGHVRLPIADDEIIDRAVAIQALADRPVRLLTCDTGQHTRGRAAGLQVTKVPAKDPGPEPDWEAQEKAQDRAQERAGTGLRAQRKAQKAAEQDA
jgi:hypothetical protein